ncbi:MAG: YiiX/YebB-like N1pC/P60 family cysteine hydrolase [Dysgonamonadaceae bacterium]
MKNFVLFLLSVCSLNQAGAINLQNGDLLFRQPCSKESVSSAIMNVTRSAGSYQFTHVGIVYIPKGTDSIFVIEATPPRVRMVPLETFLQPDNKTKCLPLTIVGRLKSEYQNSIPSALQEALVLIGKEYDDGFILENDKFYCSELIYHIFRKANNNRPLFELNVMTFKQPDSNQVDKDWQRYFDEKKLEIPEGKSGINPGAMSRSPAIDLLGEIKTSQE